MLKGFLNIFNPSIHRSVHSASDDTLQDPPGQMQILEAFDIDYRTLTILIIDDNPYLQDSMRAHLERLGAVVDCAQDGQAGLDLYLEHPQRYSLILSDIEMPRLNGFETAKHIRESGRPAATTIPIIAVTGSMFSVDPRSCLFTGSIQKPFDMIKLEIAIKQILSREVLFNPNGQRFAVDLSGEKD